MHRLACAHMYSAAPPAVVTPSAPSVRHRFSRPRRQNRQARHGSDGSDGDPITDADVASVGPRCDHGARHLVTRHDGQHAMLPGQDVQIRAAEPDGGDLDDHIVRARRRVVDRREIDRAGRRHHDRSHRSTSSSHARNRSVHRSDGRPCRDHPEAVRSSGEEVQLRRTVRGRPVGVKPLDDLDEDVVLCDCGEERRRVLGHRCAPCLTAVDRRDERELRGARVERDVDRKERAGGEADHADGLGPHAEALGVLAHELDRTPAIVRTRLPRREVGRETRSRR